VSERPEARCQQHDGEDAYAGDAAMTPHHDRQPHGKGDVQNEDGRVEREFQVISFSSGWFMSGICSECVFPEIVKRIRRIWQLA
jgi:hypothetical protein